MCFHRSTAIDLVWDGAKGVGSAQRRTRGRVLHHGSIKLGRSDLEPGIATLRDHAPDVTPASLAALVREAFAERFAITFERAEPDLHEREHAEQRAPFFASDAWVRRR
jgi:lipoate-protein ligase A